MLSVDIWIQAGLDRGFEHYRQESILKAVNLGLDTDTIAALTGAAAGLNYGYENIPEEWLFVLKEREKMAVNL